MKNSWHKNFRFLIAVLAGFFIAVYGWFISEKANDAGKKLSVKMPNNPGNTCTDENATTIEQGGQKNPNAQLFISCGGFFE